MLNNNNNLISVIMPVYNVAPYLPDSLNSVLNQTHRNLEVICVDDASTDESLSILKEFASRDKRVRVLCREKNGWMAAARNDGLSIATGEFIYFLDSDDYIPPNYLEKLLEKMSGVDIAMNINIIKTRDGIEEPFPQKYLTLEEVGDGRIFSNKDAIAKTSVHLWTQLFRKSFLDKYNLKFPSGFMHEDDYFHHATKLLANGVFVFFGPPYYYRQRADGFVATRKTYFEPYLKIVNLLIDFYCEHREVAAGSRCCLIAILLSLKNGDDFKIAKPIVDKFVAANLSLALEPIEQFAIEAIASVATYDEFLAKFGNNLQLAFIRRKMRR